MKRTVFICSLVFLCLATGGAAQGQTKAPKSCPFNIVGTWKSESGSPIYFSFAADGSVTLLSPSTSIPGENFEVVAAFYGGPCVAELARAFENDLTHAKARERREAKAPFLQRLIASVARLMAPQL